MTRMVLIAVRLPEPVLKRLDERAAACGRDRGTLIQEAVAMQVGDPNREWAISTLAAKLAAVALCAPRNEKTANRGPAEVAERQRIDERCERLHRAVPVYKSHV